MKSSLRIIVTGLIAQHPLLGGVTWDYLQYVLGLARLGHDVYYFEDSGQWPYNRDGGPLRQDWIAYDCTPNVRHLSATMARFGLEDRWAYRFPIDAQWFGLTDGRRAEVLRSSDLLINVSGTLNRPWAYRRIPRLVYVDSDPVFSQIRLQLTRGQTKFRKRVAAHDMWFSFGEALSESVPATGYRWLPTRQPIVLSEWRPGAPRRDVFTTVMSWTSYSPLRYRGQRYGQKDVEFNRFLDLASAVHPIQLEVALSKTAHINWQAPIAMLPTTGVSEKQWLVSELLGRHGWTVVEAGEVGGDLDRYRAYLESSLGEWSVAKNGYVQGQPGWFSCRSACYLAAGRPVVVQDTGFTTVLPVGEGIVSFRTLNEARDALAEVHGNYARHARAARAIAETFFDAARVLNNLIEQATSGTAERSPAARSDANVHR
jgi:hypothetical protein